MEYFKKTASFWHHPNDEKFLLGHSLDLAVVWPVKRLIAAVCKSMHVQTEFSHYPDPMIPVLATQYTQKGKTLSKTPKLFRQTAHPLFAVYNPAP